MYLAFFTLPWFCYFCFKQKELYHAARFEKETRYYSIRLEYDLLDDWVIIVANGRCKSNLGQTRTIAYSNFDEAFDQFCFMVKKRYQRRYHLVSYQSDDTLYEQILFLCFKNKPFQKINSLSCDKKTKLSISSTTKKNKIHFREAQQLSFSFLKN